MMNDKSSYEIGLFTDNHFQSCRYKDRNGWDLPERLVSAIRGFKKAVPDALNFGPGGDGAEAAKLVHSSEYVGFILEGASLDPGFSPCPTELIARKELIYTQPETYKGKHTIYFYDDYTIADRGCCEGALKGAGLSRTAAEWVLESPDRLPRMAYVAVRPPGHHAFRGMGGGLCIFNNAAIAASVLRSYGKVAVIDVDQDHGNGTQSIFYDDSDVLTISIHVEGWPYVAGFESETGTGKGKGNHMNAVLPVGADWDRYFLAYEKCLNKVNSFSPDFLVVSLGFDAHRDDGVPSLLSLNGRDYGKIGHGLSSLGLPTVITQEGGYHLFATRECSGNFFRAWNGNKERDSKL